MSRAALSTANHAFLESIKIGYKGWYDGASYELKALTQNAEIERKPITAMLV